MAATAVWGGAGEVNGSGAAGVWAETLEQLFGELQGALRAAEGEGALDVRGGEAAVAIVRRVLRETAGSLSRDAERELRLREVLARRARGRHVAVEVKDLWGLSSLSTLLAVDDEAGGRRCASFLAGTVGAVDASASQSRFADSLSSAVALAAFRDNHLTHGARPLEAAIHDQSRAYVCYAFSISLAGRAWLESEARALWADAVPTPLGCNRRYSEFAALHQRLVREWRYRVGATAGKVRLIYVPPLPGKASGRITVSRRDGAFVNERRRQLELWLRYVSLHRLMSVSAPLRRFLLEPKGSAADAAQAGRGGRGGGSVADGGLAPVSSRASVASGVSEASFATSAGLSVYNPSVASLRLRLPSAGQAEDPIVAARARAQISEVLLRYGSATVALSAAHTQLPPLIDATQAAKHAVRRLQHSAHAEGAGREELGMAFLRLSQTEQRRPRVLGEEARELQLDPCNLVGIAMFKQREDHVLAHGAAVEAVEMLERTLALFAKSALPEMTKHVRRLHVAEARDRAKGGHEDLTAHRGQHAALRALGGRQGKGGAGAGAVDAGAGAGVGAVPAAAAAEAAAEAPPYTPQERLAAEWLEVGQVRSAMLVKACEDVVQAQIVLAAQRKARWESLRSRLLALDDDALLRELQPATAAGGASASTSQRGVPAAFQDRPDGKSFAELLRETDRASVASSRSPLTPRDERASPLSARSLGSGARLTPAATQAALAAASAFATKGAAARGASPYEQRDTLLVEQQRRRAELERAAETAAAAAQEADHFAAAFRETVSSGGAGATTTSVADVSNGRAAANGSAAPLVPRRGSLQTAVKVTGAPLTRQASATSLSSVRSANNPFGPVAPERDRHTPDHLTPDQLTPDRLIPERSAPRVP